MAPAWWSHLPQMLRGPFLPHRVQIKHLVPSCRSNTSSPAWGAGLSLMKSHHLICQKVSCTGGQVGFSTSRFVLGPSGARSLLWRVHRVPEIGLSSLQR